MSDAAHAEHLKRQGAAAERQGVLEMLGRMRHHYEQQSEVFTSGGRRRWYGRRIQVIDEIITLVRDRDACGTAAVLPLASMSAGEENPSEKCTECGRFARPRERWVFCTTCLPGEMLPICSGCIDLHQAVHAARGDEPTHESLVEDDERVSEQEDPALANAVVEAMDDFDRRVRDIMADSSAGDTVAICAGCDGILQPGDSGICQRCSPGVHHNVKEEVWLGRGRGAR